MSSSHAFLDPIVIPLIRGKTVLDVACGYGRWGGLIRSNYWESGMSEPPIVDGFDAFEPNVAYCESQGHYRKVWHQKMPSPLEGKWDTVLACEIVEHLPQEDVDKTLDIFEGAASKMVIVTTPSRPEYRPGLNSIVGFNQFEAHLSYVSADHLVARGYEIIGAGFGFPDAALNIAVKKAKVDLSPIFEALARFVPEISNSIVAFKNV